MSNYADFPAPDFTPAPEIPAEQQAGWIDAEDDAACEPFVAAENWRHVRVRPADRFSLKDSGERVEYPSGFRRDTIKGKVDYTLLPLEFLERWAEHMTKGAGKYGRENWRLADPDEVGEDDGLTPLERFRSSAFRHFMQWLRGDRDEDHAAAVAFNVAAAEFVLGRLENHCREDVRVGVDFTEEPPF